MLIDFDYLPATKN